MIPSYRSAGTDALRRRSEMGAGVRTGEGAGTIREIGSAQNDRSARISTVTQFRKVHDRGLSCRVPIHYLLQKLKEMRHDYGIITAFLRHRSFQAVCTANKIAGDDLNWPESQTAETYSSAESTWP
jgi:hypothetical protein